MTEKELSALSKCFLFAGANPPESLLELEVSSFKKGETVCDETRECNALGIVLDGQLIAFPCGENKTVLSQFSAGDCFGVASMFGGNRYVSRIVSAKDSKVMFLSEEKIKELIAASSEFAVNYISFLSSRIRLLNQKISLFTSSDSTARVYSYILSNSGDDGRFDGGNMSMLAKSLCIGRTTLYRELNRLCEQNLVKKEKGIYYVL